MTTPLFQLSVKNEAGQWQNIGKPMLYEIGCIWQDIVAKANPNETVILRKVVAQYVTPIYTVDNAPCLLVLGREGFA